jgi:GxxExxY protein
MGMNGINGMNGIEGKVALKGELDVTQAVIGAAFIVSNGLGCGFLENVYENALCVELKRQGHDVQRQRSIEVRWREEIVGVYQPDMIVDEKVIVELKAVRALDKAHWAQCMNYLRVAGMRLGLLLNFGLPRLEIQRITLD